MEKYIFLFLILLIQPIYLIRQEWREYPACKYGRLQSPINLNEYDSTYSNSFSSSSFFFLSASALSLSSSSFFFLSASALSLSSSSFFFLSSSSFFLFSSSSFSFLSFSSFSFLSFSSFSFLSFSSFIGYIISINF